MSTSLVTSIENKTFVTKLDKVEFSTTDDSVNISITVDGIELLNENYVPDSNGNIILWDVCALLTPFLKSVLVAPVTIAYTSQPNTDPLTATFKAIYTSAVIEQTTQDYIETRFFTHATKKITTAERKEMLYMYIYNPTQLHFYGTYDDGTTDDYDFLAQNTNYDTVAGADVSAYNFAVDGKRLVSYTIVAGQRIMNYQLQPTVETAVSLAFLNSFGCIETIYCIGIHEFEPTYERKTAYVEGYLRNIDVEEVKKFKVYTGTLSPEMSNWADDLFRSPNINIFTLGTNHAPIMGREICITDAKAVRSNADDYLPNFYFEYQFAQRNHNVIDQTRAGRIFDDSFDNSFE